LTWIKKIKRNVRILFVSRTPSYGDIIERAAINCKMPYRRDFWISGELSNDTRTYRKPEHWKYPTGLKGRYIQWNIGRAFEMTREYDLDRKRLNENVHQPDLIIIPDISNNLDIVKEAKIARIPIIGLINSNVKVAIDYPIFCNDNSIECIDFFCNLLSNMIKKGLARVLCKRALVSSRRYEFHDFKKVLPKKEIKKKKFLEGCFDQKLPDEIVRDYII